MAASEEFGEAIVQLTLHDLQIPVRLGCTQEERAYPQIVVFNIELELSSSDSLTSDKLKDTVDYMSVIEVTKKVSRSKEFALLEHLVHEVGCTVLNESENLSKVSISAKKHISPVTQGITFSATFSS
ncbi:dihydroneopterin aldolase [bacterium]|nr:dihydroneopterin aldolase [bacterium]